MITAPLPLFPQEETQPAKPAHPARPARLRLESAPVALLDSASTAPPRPALPVHSEPTPTEALRPANACQATDLIALQTFVLSVLRVLSLQEEAQPVSLAQDVLPAALLLEPARAVSQVSGSIVKLRPVLSALKMRSRTEELMFALLKGAAPATAMT